MKYTILILLSLFVLADTKPRLPIESAQPWAINVDDPTTSTVTEESFNRLIAEIYALYKDDSPRKMVVGIQDWISPYFSAWAYKIDDETYTINFWGGFARIPGMTKKAFALVVCHEIGHVMGGEPLHTVSYSSDMSAEGQADYFATQCLKRYLDQNSIEGEIELDPYAAAKCFETFESEDNERRLCEEVAMAGQSLGAVFDFLDKEQELPSYSTPSNLVVDQTLYDSYPTIQCRIDTFLSGATEPFYAEQGAKEYRPKCWFNPSN